MKMFDSGGRKRRIKNGRFVKKSSKRPRIEGEDENKVKSIEENHDNKSWRIGRRIVELGLIADQLKSGCSVCQTTLNLIGIVEETKQGLGSILYIECEKCGCSNSVKTGKTHRDQDKKQVGRPIWDINTKAATGALNTGLGATGVNSFLTALNIPWINKTTYKNREKEASKGIVVIAEESCEDALHEEVQRSCSEKENNESTLINASFDAGWQKRGSGRAYNSLSGHSTMIGTKSQKVIDFSVRSKQCRICEAAEREQRTPKDHACHRNWSGSAKSMESSMGVEMCKNLSGSIETDKDDQKTVHYNIGNIIMDGDTTTIAHIHKEVNPDIGVWSDIGHAKKALYNHLMTIGSQHKALSKTVADYLTKCFGYVLTQNKGNPEEISKGCRVIPKHAFGDHCCCGDWCSYKKDPSKYHHKSLPYGKDLEGEELKADLVQVFDLFASYAPKLAPLGSTQSNESINNSIAVRAPKRIHFSGSDSLKNRVALTVACKNKGPTAICEINAANNLSPGTITLSFNKSKDKKYKDRITRENSKKFKRRRVERKKQRNKVANCKEVLEGVTYKSKVQFQSTASKDDITSIPEACYPPTPSPLDLPLSQNTFKPVVFDLETSNLGLQRAEICQLSAVSLNGDAQYDQYVIPQHGIAPQASKANNLTILAGQMLYRCKPVPATTPHNCLVTFLDFLKSFHKPVVLLAHNNRVFDARILLKTFQQFNLLEELKTVVYGFVDTLPLFRQLLPEKKSHKQDVLVEECLGCKYDAHNGLEDATELRNLLNHLNPSDQNYSDHSFSFQFVCESLKHHERIVCNQPSLLPLVKKKVLSSQMARKIAGSDLNKKHLELIYTRASMDGLTSVLSEKSATKTRVTSSRKIITKLADYLSKKFLISHITWARPRLHKGWIALSVR